MNAIDATPYIDIVPQAAVEPKVEIDRLVRALELKIAGSWAEAGGAMRWAPADWQKETRGSST